MNYIGIDIGSTASKTVVMNDDKIINSFTLPTGWNCKDTAMLIMKNLEKVGFNSSNSKIVATGYGRVSVPYADKIISEITCHGMGGKYLFSNSATIIDIGGQDTKVITVKNGKVEDFIMNDKCSAGTGKFIEIMSNRLGLSIEQLCRLAKGGSPIQINSMCTVFAESEIIGFIGKGEDRANIARGILDSVATKVFGLANKQEIMENCFLTGGLCQSEEFIEILSEKLERNVLSSDLGRFAGAIGAAVMAKNL